MPDLKKTYGYSYALFQLDGQEESIVYCGSVGRIG